MAGLHLYWDPEIDGPFRRRLERALAELQVDFADASAVDADPDAARPVKLAIVAARGQAPASDADLIVLGGPGDLPNTSALRLETSDIEARSKRWIAFAEKLGLRLNRPGLARFAASDASPADISAAALAFPADPLARDASISLRPDVLHAQLAAMQARAEDAERAVATAALKEADAVREKDRTEAKAASGRARLAAMEQTIERLTAQAESTIYALGSVRMEYRAIVNTAREHAWRARLAAARAASAADEHPDALTWPKAHAIYSGETLNRLPHGHGVMVFRNGAEEIARYSGAFVDGRRVGHGVATSDGGLTWHGEWKDNETHGFGILETPAGRRFEGEVAPDEAGAPRRVRGWTWDGAVRQQDAHRPVTAALSSPQTSSQAGG